MVSFLNSYPQVGLNSFDFFAKFAQADKGFERREPVDIEDAQIGRKFEQAGVFFRCGEERELLFLIPLLSSWSFCFEREKHFLCAFDRFVGKAGEFGDVDAIALVGAPFDDLAEKDDAAARFVDGDVVIDCAWDLLF